VFLDCPPALGVLSVNALSAAKAVLVPVEASPLALAGLSDLSNLIADVKEEVNEDLYVAGVLVCRANARRTVYRDTMEALSEAFPNRVCPVPIREDVCLTEAPGHRRPITLYAPRCHGADDYRQAGEWLRTMV